MPLKIDFNGCATFIQECVARAFKECPLLFCLLNRPTFLIAINGAQYKSAFFNSEYLPNRAVFTGLSIRNASEGAISLWCTYHYWKSISDIVGTTLGCVLTYIDVKVAIDRKDADLIVEILHDGPGSQIASSSAVGQITGYNIDDVVVFRVFDKAGNELIPETQIYGVRDTNFSVSTVLSADIAQQQAIADIRKELAMQITIRLMSIGRRANR